MVDNLGIYNSQVESDYDINKHIEQGIQFKQFKQDSYSEIEYKFLQESTAPDWGSIVDTCNDENSTKKKGIIEGLTMSQNQVNFNNMVSQYSRDYKTYVSTYLNRPQTPLNVRYVKVTANNNGDCLQISQIVVNAIVNGAVINVAPRGTVTASPTWQNGTKPQKAIDGITEARPYPNIYHSVCSQGTFWELDLGQDYLVNEVIYYNRGDCCQTRAIGMKIQLTANNGTVHQPITLTAVLKQTFNPSMNGTLYGESRKASEDALLIQKNNILAAANQINSDVQLSNATRAELMNAFNGTQRDMRFNLNSLNEHKKKLNEMTGKYDLESINGAMETTELNMNSMYYHAFVYMLIALTLFAYIFNLMVNPNASVLNAIFVLGALFMVYIISRYFVN
jgi:hypothetical protein